jgi:hypothetical protein
MLSATQCIELSDNFCTIIQTKNEFIKNVFPDILNNNLDHNKLSNRANFDIKIVDKNETVILATEFLNSLGVTEMPTELCNGIRLVIKNITESVLK